MLSTAQIGRCGELLVQYELLLCGIESAALCTDVGVDLVAYSPKQQAPLTIQIKSNLKSKPGGGKGKMALDWWIEETNPAQLLALVDLSLKRVWMLRKGEVATIAQQRSGGRWHIYMYTDPTCKPRSLDRLSHSYEFEKYRLENRVHELFGL